VYSRHFLAERGQKADGRDARGRFKILRVVIYGMASTVAGGDGSMTWTDPAGTPAVARRGGATGRRAFLAGVTAGAAILAGCLGGDPTPPGGTGDTNDGVSRRGAGRSPPRATFDPVNFTYRGQGIVRAEYYPRATTQLETHEWELPATVVLNPPKVTRYGSFRETNPFTVEARDNNPSGSTRAVNFLLLSALELYDRRDDTELLFQYWEFDHDPETGEFSGVLRAEYNNEISNTLNLPEELYEGLVISMPTPFPDGCEIRGIVDESRFRVVVHGTNGRGEYVGVFVDADRV
jgi:hypothetical protein